MKTKKKYYISTWVRKKRPRTKDLSRNKDKERDNWRFMAEVEEIRGRESKFER